MATLRVHETGQRLGNVSQPDARVLRRTLESASSSKNEYYIDTATLGLLVERGLTPSAATLLRDAMNASGGLTVAMDGDDSDSGEESGDDESEAASVAGQPLVCVVCKSAHFQHRRAQLHSALASFVNLEWLGPTADCYICENCGYVHWFIPPK